LTTFRQPKIVLHLDPSGVADPLPFGISAPPYVIVRVQPMAGELCRYVVTSSDPDDEGEEDIVHTASVPARVVQTSKCYLNRDRIAF
jgi:protein ECT2